MTSQKIIVPLGGSYPTDAIIESSDGICFPLGGGFGFRLKDRSFFREVTQEELAARHYRPAQYSIDGGQAYSGHSTGRRWNGWECPLFTREVAEQILSDAGLKFDYLAESDQFRVLNEYAHPEEDPCEYAQGIEHAGVRLYPIMDGWCWDEVTGEPDDE